MDNQQTDMEKATALANDFLSLVDDVLVTDRDYLIALIASALRESKEEGFAEGMGNKCDKHIRDLVCYECSLDDLAKKVEKSRNVGLEEAKKIFGKGCIG